MNNHMSRGGRRHGAALSCSEHEVKPTMFDAPFRDAHLGLNMGLDLLKSLTMHNAHLFVNALCKSDTTGLSS